VHTIKDIVSTIDYRTSKMTVQKSRLILFPLAVVPMIHTGAFVLVPRPTSIRSPTKILSEKGGWDSADDWSKLSVDSPDNALDTSSIFNLDAAWQAAQEMGSDQDTFYEPNDDDAFISDAVDTIHSPAINSDTPALYDTKGTFDQYTKSVNFFDEMGKEISLLVRCNEDPHDLLVSLGKVLPELKDEEKYDAKQLLREIPSPKGVKSAGRPTFEPTEFFANAVGRMFDLHASPRNGGEDPELRVLDSTGVASWMTKSLKDHVGRHEKRVTIVVSKYSSHGTGFLTQPQFMQLYMDAALLSTSEKKNAESRGRRVYAKKPKLEQPTINSVWRDLENHGVRPPIISEREVMQAKLDEKYGVKKDTLTKSDMMDECEILEWADGEHSTPRDSSTSQMQGATADTKKSSHELVELASDGKTPKRLRDGDFVFIDEESCIGCKQCANVAPSAFVMSESGRARTYSQNNTPEVAIAVSVCPVGCMHNVAFHELKEMETARDVIGALPDDRGRNNRHIPLHVARGDSDANRKSSFYHTLKHKCYTSKSCPQRGCFDCPMYAKNGDNPHFKKLHTKAEHVRALDIMESGEVDDVRNMADL